MARQLSLWEGAEPSVLVDADGARIVYYPRVLDPAAAAEAFAFLEGNAPWERLRRMMYDREVDVPRLVAHYEGEVAGWPEVVRALKGAVEQVCGAPFTSVGMNFYRDGNDSVAWHSDEEGLSTATCRIALTSLGATRRLGLRTKAVPRKTLYLDLEPGSVLLMSGATQRRWEHAIPKSPDPVDPRISVVFRQRQLGVSNAAARRARLPPPPPSPR